MTVAIMSAIPGELALLRDGLGGETILVESGVGKVNAALVTTGVILEHRPDVILFTGVAGGLDPKLSIGDVVMGEWTVQWDAGVATKAGFDIYQAGHIPFFNPTDDLGYRPSTELLTTANEVAAGLQLEAVLDREPKIVSGTILTGDRFVDDPVTRDHLHQNLNAQAVEMEGAAVAQVAAHFGVDCLVVRALSDLAGGGADIDFRAFFPIVAANSARLVGALLSRVLA